MVVGFKTNMEISENPFSFQKITYREYFRGMVQRSFNIYFTNSLIVTIPNVILVVFLSSIAGLHFQNEIYR